MKTTKQQSSALKKILKDNDLTRVELATMLKVSERHVYDILNDPEKLTIKKATQLGKITSLSLSELTSKVFE